MGEPICICGKGPARYCVACANLLMKRSVEDAFSMIADALIAGDYPLAMEGKQAIMAKLSRLVLDGIDLEKSKGANS